MTHKDGDRGMSRTVTGVGLALLTGVAAVAVVGALRAAGPQPAGAGSTSAGDAGAGRSADAAAGAKVDAILNSVIELLRRGERGQAETVLRSALQTYPEEPRLYVSLAEVLAGDRRADEAYAMYEKALACGPRDGPTEFAAGTAASMAGKLDRAEEHYQAARQRNPSDYQATLFLAQVQIKQEKLTEAAANLVIAAKLNPDAGVVWGSLADLELRQNKNSLALQHAQQARALEPRVALWRLLEARALKREGRPEEALQSLLAMDATERRTPAVTSLMAECYGLLKKPADAAAMYVALVTADGADGASALQAAMWLEKAGDKTGALKWAKHAEMLAVPGAKEAAARLALP